MKKHLTAIGNSLGIIIDKPILELLEIDKDIPLDVKTDGHSLIITPLRDEAPRKTGKAGAGAPPPPHAGVAESPEVSSTEPAPPPKVSDEKPKTKEARKKPSAPRPPQIADEPSLPGPPVAASEEEIPSNAATEESAAVVVVELRGDEKLRVPLVSSKLTIGRDKTADIHLDDRALSRKHAQLERRGAAIWVVDLGSANGTYVNGEEIPAPTRLHGGDVIGLGHYRLHLEGLEEAEENTPVLTLDGPEGQHRFAMVGEEITIGRAQTCDISIGHKSISRRHMRIALAGDQFSVEDLGSQNGVKINGDRIDGPTKFNIGDKLEMCEFSVVLGYLKEEAESGGPGNGEAKSKKPRTMLIDRSVLANAAYFDGDFDGAQSQGGMLAMGAKGGGAKTGDTGEFEVPDEMTMGQPSPPGADDGTAPPSPPNPPGERAHKKPKVVRSKKKKKRS